MSVHEPAVRSFSQAAIDEINALRPRYPTTEALLLPVLHIAQREWGGWLPDEAVTAVARELELPAARVYGEHARRPLKVRRELGVGEDEVTPDGRCSYVHFECLGSCDTAPMMMVDDDYHENLTPNRVRQILKGLK